MVSLKAFSSSLGCLPRRKPGTPALQQDHLPLVAQERPVVLACHPKSLCRGTEALNRSPVSFA